MGADEQARWTVFAKAFAVWLLLMMTAIANGFVRERLLVPRLGSGTAHVASTALLCLLIFAITLATIGWIAPRSAAGAIAVVVVPPHSPTTAPRGMSALAARAIASFSSGWCRSL